jgi:hypothetical protein
MERDGPWATATRHEMRARTKPADAIASEARPPAAQHISVRMRKKRIL